MKSAFAVLVAATFLAAATQVAMAQESPIAGKAPEAIRIGLVKPKVQVGAQEASMAADSVRTILTEYLQGPSIEVVLLSARLPSQYLVEAQQADCDFILASTLTHQRGGLAAKIGQSVGKLAVYAPWIPSSGGASSVLVSGVLLTAADFATSIRAKDVMRIEYRLEELGADEPLLERSEKRKASADGEDLLTPLVEGAAEAVGQAVSRY